MTDPTILNFNQFASVANYSLVDNLKCDPEATPDGIDREPREIFSGHYVPVTPTPLPNPEYVIHSKTFFSELGISDQLIQDATFNQVFSADLSAAPHPMRKLGWATGYALSIYGTEYTNQCPFMSGNGYGDGRAISVFEGIFSGGKRWEMQLKGAGKTPYCRGADGRAVLRSSVREFLAQEYMHALGVPTSRSLCLYRSKSETVLRPWYTQDSTSFDPDIMLPHPVAITTRVAPSFLRVGQVELFARRVRSSNYSHQTVNELKLIVRHLIAREYCDEINQTLPFEQQIVHLATAFRSRLTQLVANWLRVGYCQGNFNSDNCAAGGFTLDYGPFGFCEWFNPWFQPWTGGGKHFSFFNQPKAAQLNFKQFCSAIGELLPKGSSELDKLNGVYQDFEKTMQFELEKAWCAKLGLDHFNHELFHSLLDLAAETPIDYSIFFRELSNIPLDVVDLKKCFYQEIPPEYVEKWQLWIGNWRSLALSCHDANAAHLAEKMKKINPKYTWREWQIVPAYQEAAKGNYSLIHELQEVFSHPYDEQSAEMEHKYYQRRPEQYFKAGGISHFSCSS